MIKRYMLAGVIEKDSLKEEDKIHKLLRLSFMFGAINSFHSCLKCTEYYRRLVLLLAYRYSLGLVTERLKR
jgi:hypothetical protein